MNLKMQKAASLLTATTLPVSAVAEYLGYQDPTNLIRGFKKQYEMTPAQYRKNILSCKYFFRKFPDICGSFRKNHGSLKSDSYIPAVHPGFGIAFQRQPVNNLLNIPVPEIPLMSARTFFISHINTGICQKITHFPIWP